MKWDFKYATSHHDSVGVCGPIEDDKIMHGKGGIKGYMIRKLEESGELSNQAIKGSWFPWRCKNKLYTVVSAEPYYRKRFGEPPELPFGGPHYDARGMKKLEGK